MDTYAVLLNAASTEAGATVNGPRYAIEFDDAGDAAEAAGFETVGDPHGSSLGTLADRGFEFVAVGC